MRKVLGLYIKGALVWVSTPYAEDTNHYYFPLVWSNKLMKFWGSRKTLAGRGINHSPYLFLSN